MNAANFVLSERQRLAALLPDLQGADVVAARVWKEPVHSPSMSLLAISVCAAFGCIYLFVGDGRVAFKLCPSQVHRAPDRLVAKHSSRWLASGAGHAPYNFPSPTALTSAGQLQGRGLRHYIYARLVFPARRRGI